MASASGVPIDPRLVDLAAAAHQREGVAQSLYLRELIASQFGTRLADDDSITEVRDAPLLLALETVGFDLDRRRPQEAAESLGGLPVWRELLWPAYRLRRAIRQAERMAIDDPSSITRQFAETLDGLAANRQPELRHILKLAKLPPLKAGSARWDEYIESQVKRAFIALVRKDGGRSDVEEALRIVADLRKAQAEGEVELASIEDPWVQHFATARCVALYNCARSIELAASYLMGNVQGTRGQPLTAAGVKTEVDRHFFNAREVLRGVDPQLLWEVERLNRAAHLLIDSSIYAVTLPRSVRAFVDEISRRQDRPVLELWYAQRQAIQSSLLDPTRTGIVVSLPTSSGKTLLAEMAIVQALKDSPEERIVYLAPTRALVTQIALTLRKDLASQGVVCQVATPAFELDSVESEVLSGNYNTLITTWEKMDLLVRENHPSVAHLSLLVVDEAHNIADSERGARLELLISTLKRERPGCRFLLLTPFAGNADSVAKWIGGEQSASIVVDWKPNDRAIGFVETKGHGRAGRSIEFTTLSSAHSDFPEGIQATIQETRTRLFGDADPSKKALSTVAAEVWANGKGSVLILADTRKHAQQRAATIASARPLLEINPAIEVVCRFLETEAGGEHPLAEMLRKGVAFHHAGLSPEVRYFVERLVESSVVSVVCATTTLAQGVHFPLSVAIVESTKRSIPIGPGRFRWEDLKPWEFWNLAGRVGRSLEDSLGVIAFVSMGESDVEAARTYLTRDANRVLSALDQLFQSLSIRNLNFTLQEVGRFPGLSAFLQYVVHVIAAAQDGSPDATELENAVRASFAFAQAEGRSQEVADAIIRLTRAYAVHLSAKFGDGLRGFASLADGTGFSSPSVSRVMGEWGSKAQESDWIATKLFPDGGPPSTTLVAAIATLGDIPEVHIGTDLEGEFTPEKAARIVTSWVNGNSLRAIADAEYDGNLLECSRYIYSTVSNLIPWGLGAVQRVGFAGTNVDWANLRTIPAMVYHGVHTREAVGLRMVGVPRFAAEGLAEQARSHGIKLGELRDWLATNADPDWQAAMPPGARISGNDCKRLWRILDGADAWSSLGNSANPP